MYQAREIFSDNESRNGNSKEITITIVIEPNKLISGMNPKTAQKIARFCCDFDHGADVDCLATSLGSDPETMLVWLNLLKEEGYVKETKRYRKQLWQCTQDGRVRLAAARIGKPMTYKEVEKKLNRIANRAISYNSNDRFPHFITEIKVSGLERRPDGLCQDPDIFVIFKNRGDADHGPESRFEYLSEYGPNRDMTVFDQLFFSEREMYKILFKDIGKVNLFHKELSKKDGYPFDWHSFFMANEHRNPPCNVAFNDTEEETLGWTLDTSFLYDYLGRMEIIQPKRISFADIAEYWNNENRRSDADAFSVSCWRCGRIKDLQKCHIIPKSLGGCPIT